MKICPNAAERPQIDAFDRTATGIGEAESTDCVWFRWERTRKLQKSHSQQSRGKLIIEFE